MIWDQILRDGEMMTVSNALMNYLSTIYSGFYRPITMIPLVSNMNNVTKTEYNNTITNKKYILYSFLTSGNITFNYDIIGNILVVGPGGNGGATYSNMGAGGGGGGGYYVVQDYNIYI